MSKYHDIRSVSSASHSVNDSTMRKDNQNLEIKDRQLRDAYGNYRSDSVMENAFEDRYDPSKSYDVFQDDVNSSSNRIAFFPAGGHRSDYHKKSWGAVSLCEIVRRSQLLSKGDKKCVGLHPCMDFCNVNRDNGVVCNGLRGESGG
ncbi:hypothetical protein L1049_020775 [Liquidambar formosana]|uniref:Uncharacterized protein n=1 Tax=Liquidambar formosana TaxID=63359 RepID=A0AAP0XAY6_LIQFO